MSNGLRRPLAGTEPALGRRHHLRRGVFAENSNPGSEGPCYAAVPPRRRERVSAAVAGWCREAGGPMRAVAERLMGRTSTAAQRHSPATAVHRGPVRADYLKGPRTINGPSA